MQRFFDTYVNYHGFLRSPAGDLRPMLYDAMNRGGISRVELADVGKMVKRAIDVRGASTLRTKHAVRKAFENLQSGNPRRAIGELVAGFFWSDPNNVERLARHLNREGSHTFSLGLEFKASTAHVFSGQFDGRPSIFKITPSFRSEPNAFDLSEHLTGLPVSRMLHSQATPLVDSHLIVSSPLSGNLAVSAIGRGASVSEVYSGMGGVLAKLHGVVVSPLIQNLLSGHNRQWPQVAASALKRLDGLAEALRFDAATTRSIRNVLSRSLAPAGLDSVLHDDYHEENVLVDERGRVSGLLDLGGAALGDPMYDLAKAQYYAQRAERLYDFKGAAAALQEGYKKNCALTPEAKSRLAHYVLAVSVALASPQLKYPEKKPIARELILNALDLAKKTVSHQ